MTIARASPSAIAMVVEEVGALTPNESVSDLCIGEGSKIVSGRILAISQVEGWTWDVMTMIGRVGSK